MVKVSGLIEFNTDTQIGKSQKKQSPVDATEFANFLSAQSYNSQTQKSFSVPENKANDSKASTNDSQNGDELNAKAKNSSRETDRDKNTDNTQKSYDNTDRSEEINDNKTNANNQKDGSTEASQNPNEMSNSGQETSGESALSVDGRENGIQPGASTEAAVNAQSFTITSDSQTTSELTSEDQALLAKVEATAMNDAEQTQSDLNAQINSEETFQELIDKIIAETTPTSADTENANAMKISATKIDTKPSAIQTNLNLPDQKIMFETGLAEHFVKLLTDQFEGMQSAADTSSQAQSNLEAIPEISAANINASSQNSSQSAMDLLFQNNSELQTNDAKAAENINKIVNVVRSNIGQRQSQIVVRLDPPDLGKMRVDIKLVDNNLNLTISTETAEAKQMLTSRMETLRQNLEQNNINIAKFEVVTQADENKANQNHNWQENNQQSNQNNQEYEQQNNQSEDQPEDSAVVEESSATSEPELLTNTTSSDPSVNMVA